MRRVYRILSILLMAVLLTAGCGEPISSNGNASATATAVSEGNISVYYVNADRNRSLSVGYELTGTGDAAIQELFGILKSGQFADGKPAVPETVQLDHSAWQEHSLILYLTGEYPAVGTVEELLCRYSIVMTMFQIPDMQGVTIYHDNHPLTNDQGVEVGTMTPGSFLGDVSVVGSEPEEKEITLYFANTAGDQLVPSQEILIVNSTESLEKQIMKRLIEGPNDGNGGMQATIPASTTLLSISVREKICYVNLSAEFIPENKDAATLIPIYSIVNSLTELDTIDAVQLLIAGSTDANYSEGISLTAPLERNLEFVQK